MKRIERSLLTIVFLVAIFFRFYQLTSVPPSPSVDEVSTGYNAYSILKTGKDEYGTFLPLVIRAYDDWQPALFTYLVIPFVYIFDLNIFAVRLPSVILSVLSILAVFLIMKQLFGGHEKKPRWLKPEIFALLVIFLFAISPWHIYVSRLGLPTNTGFAFFIFALLFFLHKRLYLSAVFFSLSFMSYHADKIFIPIFVFGLAVVYRSELLKQKRKVIGASILGFILILPFLNASLSSNSLVRFKATSTLNLDAHWEQNRDREISLKEAEKNKDIIGMAQHSKEFFLISIVAESYLSHFRPGWLLLNSGSEPHKIPSFGLLHPWTAPFIAIGLISFLMGDFSRKTKKLIFFWLLTAPIAGSITTDAPHALRAYTMLPVWEMFIALGILRVYGGIENVVWKKIYLTVLSFIIIIGGCILYFNYFIIFPKVQSRSFQFSLSDAMRFVSQRNASYTRVVFSNQDQLYQSYMYFLFFNKYDPMTYIKEGGTMSGGFAKSHRIGKYEFRPIEWTKEEKKENVLFAGRVGDFPSESLGKKTFYELDGNPGVVVVGEK